MDRKIRLICISVTAVFTLAAFLFFGFRYTYHIHFQEQLQLFQFTSGYFLEVCRMPGGFADWCGRFLTQFFYHARAGAAILALMLAGVQLLTWMNAGRKNFLIYCLSFVPSVILFVYLLDENAIPGAVVALLLCLAASLSIASVKSDAVRRAMLLAGIPLLYFLCGPLAVVFVLLSLRGEKFVVWFAALTVAALCPLVSQYIFSYPLSRLLSGIHYYRYPLTFPLWLYLAALSSASLCVAGLSGGWRGRFGTVSGSLSLVLLACFAVLVVCGSGNMQREEVMEYDFMLQHRMWNRCMLKADRKNPSTPMSVSCLNMALARTGRMGSNMFDYFQNGPEGLLPGFVRDYVTPIPTGEIWWHLGMVNTCQRFFFEAQEAIPDFQKSARCYKKLAETNIVNRDYAVAAKYLEALENTLFYRKWARDVGRIIADTTAIAEFPEYVRMRELRFKEHDFLFSDRDMDSMLGLLFLENKGNTIAFDYLLAWSLLKKDIDRFMQCCNLAGYLPKHWQEAALLWWVGGHKDFRGLPSNIDKGNAVRMEQFMKARISGRGVDYMKDNFGDSYWFYYYYCGQ